MLVVVEAAHQMGKLLERAALEVVAMVRQVPLLMALVEPQTQAAGEVGVSPQVPTQIVALVARES